MRKIVKHIFRKITLSSVQNQVTRNNNGSPIPEWYDRRADMGQFSQLHPSLQSKLLNLSM